MTIEDRIEKLHVAICSARISKINPCHVKSGPTGGQFCETKGGGSGASGGGGGSSAKGIKDFEDYATTLKKFPVHTVRGDSAVFSLKQRKNDPYAYMKSTNEYVVHPNGNWEWKWGTGGESVTRVSGKNLTELKDWISTRHDRGNR